MDIRTYFKGDSPVPPPPKPTPKSPPRPALLELPDFLFISAGSGVKRDRSTVAENVEDTVNTDDFNCNLHRVLSPLEVRVITSKASKDANPPPKRKKRIKSKKDDGISFPEDLEETMQQLDKLNEKGISDQNKQNNTKVIENNEMNKPSPSSNPISKSQHKTKPTPPMITTTITPTTITATATPTITPPTKTTIKQTPTTIKMPPILPPPTTIPTPPSSTTATKLTTTAKTKNTTPNIPPPISTPPTTVTTQVLPQKVQQPQNQQHQNQQQQSHQQVQQIQQPPHQPQQHIVPKKAKKREIIDVELESKIQEKKEVVQMWENKCSELRKQLSHATASLSVALDELDQLSSIYDDNHLC